MEHCIYCQRECKSRNSRVTHQRYCSDNPARVDSPFKEWKKNNPTSWNKGLTKDDTPQLARSEDLRAHLKKVVTGLASTPEKEIERCNKIRLKINERYKSGWESTAGRCKKYDYTSPIAGNIKVDGTWELRVARYFDSLGVVWKRNKTRFSYIKPDGTPSTYQPDFFIEDWNTYLEIKGYETELDRCKWAQFNEPLLVWKKREIRKIINNSHPQISD